MFFFCTASSSSRIMHSMQQHHHADPDPAAAATAAVVPDHSTWLSRYCTGDHRRVWDEIRAVGGLSPAQRAAATQVADEMMNRVLQNMHLLTNRLADKGWKSLTGLMLEPDSTKGTQIVNLLQAELKCPLPPALAAFLHTVSSIDLIWDYNDEEEEIPPQLCPTVPIHFPSLDPLYVDIDNDRLNDDLRALDDHNQHLRQGEQTDLQWEQQQQQQWRRRQPEEEHSFRVHMSPNVLQKIGSDPEGQGYFILLPFHGADPLVEVGERVHFVDYLRDALSLGGFPGLKACNLTDELRNVIGELTEDFVEF